MGGSGWGGRLFEAGRLLTFSAFSMGAYSRWALIRGWALIRINTVIPVLYWVGNTVLLYLFTRIYDGPWCNTRQLAKKWSLGKKEKGIVFCLRSVSC